MATAFFEFRDPPKTDWQKALPWLSDFKHIPTSADAEKLKLYFENNPEQLVEGDIQGRLPLHYALCQKGEHVETIVWTLHTLYPAGVRHKDIHGWLPLHLAAGNQRSLPDKRGDPAKTVVTLILSAYPEAAQQKNSFGHVPLDVAVRFNPTIPMSCKFMLDRAAAGGPAPPPPTRKGTMAPFTYFSTTAL